LTPFYKNLLTCNVCYYTFNAFMIEAKDAKKLKAFEGGLGLYCVFFVTGNQTCAKVISNAA